MTADGRPLPPVRFHHERAPGYLNLVERYSPGLYYPDGYVGRASGATLEGYRIGGMPPFQGAESRVLLEPLLGRQHAHDTTSRMRLLQQPALLGGADAGVVHKLQTGLAPSARFLARRSTYNCRDLVLCLLEAFYRRMPGRPSMCDSPMAASAVSRSARAARLLVDADPVRGCSCSRSRMPPCGASWPPSCASSRTSARR